MLSSPTQRFFGSEAGPSVHTLIPVWVQGSPQETGRRSKPGHWSGSDGRVSGASFARPGPLHRAGLGWTGVFWMQSRVSTTRSATGGFRFRCARYARGLAVVAFAVLLFPQLAPAAGGAATPPGGEGGTGRPAMA